MKNLSFLIVFTLFIAACGGKEAKSGEELLNETKKTDSTPQKPAISKEVLSDIVKSIPSPIEVTYFIRDLEIKYDKAMLNSTDNTSKYNTSYKQALNLGVYSTDLGYANIYKQTQDALYYLTAVKEMAEGLKIGQYFDFETIKKLTNSSNRLDSLIVVTNSNLERINDHLQEKDRADLTILILTGGWLETLYITCQVAKKQPNELLNNRIGEQKIILDQLLLLLSFYEDQANVKGLIDDLRALEKEFENVTITYEYKEAQTKEENGILVVDENTQQKIKFTSKDLDNILNVTMKIRQKIIN